MDNLNMKSKDIVNDNINKIAKLFPSVVKETNEGLQIDFELLKQEMSKDVLDNTKERYQLTWPGKKEAILESNSSTNKTLRPLKEKSVDFENTENIYIEGDNLEVLKTLQESYLNKIKCIYIDPPYNTGNDFIYNDKFNKEMNLELEESGQLDEFGSKLVTNKESSGRFHSDWLSMMYPRLKLSRNLLTDDGVIFISIDDNEVENLKKICDEIFGERNFLSQFIWEKHKAPRNDNKNVSKNHEYVLMYAKNVTEFNIIPDKRDSENLKNFSNPDDDERGIWQSGPLLAPTFNEKTVFEIISPISGKVHLPPSGKCWSFSKKRIQELIEDKRVWFGNDGNNVPRIKRFLSELPSGIVPRSILFHDDVGGSQRATVELRKLFSGKKIFDYSKPIGLIKYLIEKSVSAENGIILDFFSGSSTAAHATMELNGEDNGNRKYIMVQLDEATDEKSEAYKEGYKYITEIGQERIKRAAKKIKEETNADIDYGFRVYKLDSSNMKDVYYQPNEYNQDQLELFEDNLKEDRTSLDILIQVMLDLGLSLDLKIEEKSILENKVYFVENNSLVACFDDNINVSLVDELLKNKPLKLVFKESSFRQDSDKINLQERVKNLSPETEISIL